VRTPLGGYIVFDYRHCPLAKEGAEIPREYHKESGEGKRPFFFCPVEGCGTVLGQLRGFPLAYSPGFATEIEARTAAIEWETRGKIQPLEMVVGSIPTSSTIDSPPFYKDFYPGDWVWFNRQPRFRKMSDDTWFDTWSNVVIG